MQTRRITDIAAQSKRILFKKINDFILFCSHFAVSLQKISCIREIKNKFSFRSFAVSLQKTRCVSAASDTVNIRYYVLPVHTSYIGYAEDNILSGILGPSFFLLTRTIFAS